MNKPVKYVFILFLLLFVARKSALAVNEMKSVWENEPEKEAPGFWSTLFSLQPMREKDPDEKRWYLTVGGWYERKLGNTDSMRANGSADLEYKSGIAVLLVSYQQFYSELNGEQFENNISGIIKYDHYLLSYLEYFIFNQAEFNDITGLRLRNGTGTGLKFVFFRNIYWTADISAAPVFEYQRYAGEEYTLDYRASFRARVKIAVMRSLYLNCSVFYVPQIVNFGEYRFIVDTNATLNITANAAETGGLLLKAGYRRTYNTFAPPGKDKLDQFYYLQLQIRI